MPKFGSDEGAYDPFNQIGSALTALKEPESRAAEEPRHGVVEAEPATDDAREDQGQERVETPRRAALNARTIRKTVSSASSLRAVKRFKTTQEEAHRIDRAIVQLGAKLGMSVDFSKLTRALWEAYLMHEDDILRNVTVGEYWTRPANNDPVGLAELDERLSKLINEGFMVASIRPKSTR